MGEATTGRKQALTDPDLFDGTMRVNVTGCPAYLLKTRTGDVDAHRSVKQIWVGQGLFPSGSASPIPVLQFQRE